MYNECIAYWRFGGIYDIGKCYVKGFYIYILKSTFRLVMG